MTRRAAKVQSTTNIAIRRASSPIRHAPHGAQQALRKVLEADTWHPASQTFYRIDNRPSEIVSFLTH
jgi:hypothetical protein